MFAHRLQSIGIIIALFAFLCRGQRGVQENFVAPFPPDFSTEIDNGENFRIEWNKDLHHAFALYAAKIDPTDASLWITTYDGDHDGKVMIQSGVNLKETLFVDWRVAIPSSDLSKTDRWVFRFLAAGETWVRGSSQQISSVGIKVAGAVEEETTSSTTTSSKTTATPKPTDDEDSETSSTRTGTGPKQTPSADEDSDSSNQGDKGAPADSASQDPNSSGSSSSAPSSAALSGGAIAGIVIGSIAVVVLAVGLFFIWRKVAVAATGPASGMEEAHVPPLVFSGPPVELPAGKNFPSELSGSPPLRY